MNDWGGAPTGQIFYHHWLAYWKLLCGAALLVVLGLVVGLAWPLLGLGLLGLAASSAMSIYLYRTWHTLTFLEDGRLVRRRGFFGNAEDVITLFGVVTPYCIPVLGRRLNAGSVHLGIPGPDIHIRHIANFAAFYRQLVHSAQQGQRDPGPQVIHIYLHISPVP